MRFVNLSRVLFRGIKTNTPKTNYQIYDFEKVDENSPYQVRIDEHLYEPNKTHFSSSTVALVIYCAAGYLVYFGTRLMYDYE